MFLVRSSRLRNRIFCACYTESHQQIGKKMEIWLFLIIFYDITLFKILPTIANNPTDEVLRRHEVNSLCWLCALGRAHGGTVPSPGHCEGGEAVWLIIQILLRMLQRTDGMWRFKRSVGQRAFELWPLNCGSSQRAGDKEGERTLHLPSCTAWASWRARNRTFGKAIQSFAASSGQEDEVTTLTFVLWRDHIANWRVDGDN